MHNDRRDFLKKTGLAGAAAFMPFNNLVANQGATSKAAKCTLIPAETAGPFPLDITDNAFYFRQDVREDRTGAQLNLKMKIFGSDNCAPMQNVRVNIWHCDKDGFYSGYNQSGNPGQTGLTYCRGYQMTDANGEVEFITILPGWYTGRICHIHFQVYVSSAYAAISQLTFPLLEKNVAYYAHPSLYSKGPDPLTFETDNIFSDGYNYQLATLTTNDATGGYDSYFEATVLGSGTVGIGHIEKENAKQFSLGQNFPNPHSGATTVPFMLQRPSDVTLEVWDLSGRNVASIVRTGLSAGEQTLLVDLKALGLPTATYLYQIIVNNSIGRFTDSRIMTAVK